MTFSLQKLAAAVVLTATTVKASCTFNVDTIESEAPTPNGHAQAQVPYFDCDHVDVGLDLTCYSYGGSFLAGSIQMNGQFDSVFIDDGDVLRLQGFLGLHPNGDVTFILDGAGYADYVICEFQNGASVKVVVPVPTDRAVPKLVPTESNTFQAHFGNSISMDTGLMVIGAPRARSETDGGGSMVTGAAYVYRQELESGNQQLAKLVSFSGDDPSEAYAENFGESVALSGEFLVVGAPYADTDNLRDSGAAFIFKRENYGTEWTKVATLVGEDVVTRNTGFGVSVAIDGMLVVVGGRDTNAAYAFRSSDGGKTWPEVAKLIPNGATPGAQVGLAVAVHGSLVAVGAPNDGPGSVYLYDADGNWDNPVNVTADDDATTGFGSSIALRALYGGPSTTMVVGAEGSDQAFVFDVVETTVATQLLELPNGNSPGAGFGHAVALGDDIIAVGAPFDAGAGAAVVYRGGGSTWAQQAILTAVDQEAGINFGAALAISSSNIMVAVGATMGTDFLGTNGPSGAVYLNVV